MLVINLYGDKSDVLNFFIVNDKNVYQYVRQTH
ncbi:hypothetical protein XBO1_1240015 [Xenorhabdus bovienii str. oregonense]|uniref:Uncharacterized protein n=1 Tax=Xenorhabdus bovienii str. oregonense TaxID=1398202 RepID=A0A077P0P2_XENBV|nr:hypothetical protein XBO1_1240015 [Xenorhabdus bovienii str. oregonense]